MSKNRINTAAIIIISVIILSVIVNFTAKSALEKAPGVTGVDVQDERVYLTDKFSVSTFTMDGEKLMSFKFSFDPDELFFVKGSPVIYDYETATFTRFDLYFHPETTYKASKYDTVVAEGDKIYCTSVKRKEIDVFSVDFRLESRVKTAVRPYTVFRDGTGREFYTGYKSNRAYSFLGDDVLTLEKLSPGGTIIKCLAANGKLHLLSADEKFFSVRYCTFDQKTKKLMASRSKYYYPVDMDSVNGYFFVSDNTRNIIDVYSDGDKYLCRYGNKDFKEEFEKIYKYRKKLLYLGVFMNVLIIAAFFGAIALFVYSKKKVRDNAE